MKILITGSTGLLGQALSRRLAAWAEVTGLSRHAPAPSLDSARDAVAGGGERTALPGRHVVCDLLDAAATARAIDEAQPEAVIHSQALSDVDRCELEPDVAQRMNVEATAHVIRALATSAATFVYVSTDYVFDGAKRSPYVEADQPNPLSVYARSKWEGEQAALAYPSGIVVRPSTLFGPVRMNFCDAVVQAAKQGRTIEVFSDQTTSPTYTEDCAEAIEALVRWKAGGPTGGARIVHVANTGACSRLTLAYRILELLGASREVARPVRMADQRRPAPRPPYSALETTELPTVIGRRLRSWDDALQAYLRQPR
ncbi:MAG: dTDP-4-dehydrorhamnose reductase [Candidatus Omnitrophica bacterium]|nr:dTDP-4-dehydrorhamnose reductase [Candidatus Omnitrophota bacterium]